MRRFFRSVPACSSIALTLLVSCPVSSPAQNEGGPPQPADPGLEVVPFAEAPMIRQPIGMALDPAGRLLAIESNTHFRPKEWSGPEHDQIVALTDADGDGRADRREVFFDQTDMTMDVATAQDGWVYLSTRNEILRVRDTDNDGRADKIERRLVWLETEGRYPHNGLSGLAFDNEGGLYFGMGENLGAAYTLSGSDGATVSDEGEGGNVWHIQLDGSGLRRVATGFWNPFGVCMDDRGHVFATDNDPDSSPPCRLLHIVEGGDYGYQFRYGRSGLHPFVSWNGQRLGTLPMIAGTGEAPCDILFYAPAPGSEFRGLPDAWHRSLLVASWVDHRIESYQIEPRDGTFKATRKILCQGGQDFRPVAFAVAKDGALYVSDWVRRDYELHGQGRVWLVRAREPRTFTPAPAPPPQKDAASELIDRIRNGPAPLEDEALAWIQHSEPCIYHAAVERLSREPLLVRELASMQLLEGRERAALLLATRRGLRKEGAEEDRPADPVRLLIQKSLADPDPGVALLALHWIADDRIALMRPNVQALLGDESLTPALYYAAVTTLARLDSAATSEKELVERLKQDILDPDSGMPRVRRALEILPDRDRHLSLQELEPLLERADKGDRAWLVHLVGLLRQPGCEALMRRIAFEPDEDTAARAAALCHIDSTPEDAAALMKLATGSSPELRVAALQALTGVPLSYDQRQQLRPLQSTAQAQLVARVLGEKYTSPRRPALQDVAGWEAFLRDLPGEPDLARGLAVFTSPRLGGCAMCHRAEGLGSPAGPNLSQIASTTDASYLLESLLQPSRNVAPQFESFVITTNDGQSRTAFQLAERGGTHTYIDLGGQTFDVKIDDILRRERLPVSIMPEGLVTRLTDVEIRDLIAYLRSLAAPE